MIFLSPGSTRTWKASLGPSPWKIISRGFLPPDGIEPTTNMIRPSSPQKSPGNFIFNGRLTSYKVNSEAKVIGLSGSSRWTSPVSLGGNGICWQAVAAHGSRAGGDHVRSQLQRRTLKYRYKTLCVFLKEASPATWYQFFVEETVCVHEIAVRAACVQHLGCVFH